ncbi:MAG: hypothetical protein ACI8W8_002980, partial [Rhodothermales bacterium]
MAIRGCFIADNGLLALLEEVLRRAGHGGTEPSIADTKRIPAKIVLEPSPKEKTGLAAFPLLPYGWDLADLGASSPGLNRHFHRKLKSPCTTNRGLLE